MGEFTADTLKLILNIVLGVFALLGFLWGLKRGIKRASLRFLIFLIFVIGLGIATPFISSALGNITIPGQGVTFHEMINTAIQENEVIADLMTNCPSVSSFITQIPNMVVNLVVFVLGLYVLGLVELIVFWIVSAIVFRKEKREKKELKKRKKGIVEPTYTLVNGTPMLVEPPKKRKKHRLLGGLVGAVQGAALLFATLLPVSGIVGVITQVAPQEPISAETEVNESSEETFPTSINELIKSSVPPEIMNFIYAYDNSILGKVGGVANFDTFCFDRIASIKVGDERISLGKEILTFCNIYDKVGLVIETAQRITSINDFEELTSEDFDNIEGAIDLLFDSSTMKTLAPELIKYGVSKIDVEGLVDDEALQNFAQSMLDYIEEKPELMASLKTDVMAVVKILRIVVENDMPSKFSQEPINLDEIKAIFKNNDYKVTDDLISAILSSDTVKRLWAEGVNYGLDVLERVLQKEVPSTFGTVSLGRVAPDTVNWTNVKTNMLTIVKDGVYLFETFEEFDVENIDEIFDLQYETVVRKAFNIIDCIQNFPILKATAGNANIYNNIMTTLNATKYGEYVDFTVTASTNFWSTNADAIIDTFKVVKDIKNNIDTDVKFSEYDFAKISQAVSSLFDSGVVRAIRSNVLGLLKEEVLDGADLGQFNAIVDNVFENLQSSDNGSLDRVKNDVLAVVNVAKEVCKSGLIDKFVDNETINISSVLTYLKTKDANQKTPTDRIVENLFSTNVLKSISIDLVNIGIDTLEKSDLIDVAEGDLGRVSDSNVNWATLTTQIKNIFNQVISVEMLDEPITVSFDGQNFEIPVDVPDVIERLGNILSQIKGLDIFNSNKGNVINNVLSNLHSEKLDKYVDLSVLTDNTVISTEFTRVSEIVELLMNNGLIDEVNAMGERESSATIMAFVKLFAKTTTVNNQQRTIGGAIVEKVLASNFIDRSLSALVDALNEKNIGIPDLSEGAEEGDKNILKFNKSALATETEKANIVAMCDNVLKYFDTLDSLSFSLDEILNSNFGLLGSALDNIKATTLLAPFDDDNDPSTPNYYGAYNYIIDFAGSFLQGYADFSETHLSTFSWNEELTSLSSIVTKLKELNVTIGGETKNGIDAIISNNLTDLLKAMNEGNIEDILGPIIDTKTMKKIVLFAINTANDTIVNMLPNSTPAVDITDTSLLTSQKAEILDVFKKALPMISTTPNVDLDTMTPADFDKLINLVEVLRINAKRTANNGVFKQAYDALDVYLRAESPSTQFTAILNHYDNIDDILRIAKDLKSTTSATVRSAVVKVMKELNSNDNEYGEIAGKIYDLAKAIEADTNDDLVEILRGQYGYSAFAGLSKTKLDNTITFLSGLTGISEIDLLIDVDLTNQEMLTAINNIETKVDALIATPNAQTLTEVLDAVGSQDNILDTLVDAEYKIDCPAGITETDIDNALSMLGYEQEKSDKIKSLFNGLN